MRAAVLLIPLVAGTAVTVVGAPPDYDSSGNDLMMTNSVDLNAVDYNVVGMPTGPDWAGDGNWIYGGTEESGANWYIDLRTSDFEARPVRVIVRSDDAAVDGSRYGFIEREMTIDCGKYRYRIERMRHYDREGRSVGPEQRGGGPLVMAEVESIHASVAQAACTHGTITGEMYGNVTVMNGM